VSSVQEGKKVIRKYIIGLVWSYGV